MSVEIAGSRPRSGSRTWSREAAFAWVLLGPILLLIGLVIGLPLIGTAWTSVSSTSLNGTVNSGLTMYFRAFADPAVPRAIINGLIWALVSMFAAPFTGLALAALTEDGPIRPKPLFRFLFFAPYFFSLAVAGIVFGRLYDPSFGLINSVLHSIGIPVTPQWLGDSDTALAAVIVIFLWHEIPFSFIAQSAAIRQIDRSLYEAARLDGASGPQIFRYITVPAVRTVTRTLMAIMLVAGLLSFAVVYAVTFPALGGPSSSTEIVPTLIFKQGLLGTNKGEAAALSMLLIVTVVILMLGGASSLRDRGSDD